MSTIKHIAFSPDSNQLLEVSGASVRVHNIDSGEQDLRVSGAILTHGQISPDGRLIAASSSDGHNITLWDKKTGSALSHVSTGSRANSVEFSPDGKWLVATSESSGLKLWHLDNKSERVVVKFDVSLRTKLQPPTLWQPLSGLRLALGNNKYIRPVQFSSDNKVILATGPKNNASIYDSTTGELKQLYEGHENSVTTAQFGPLEKVLITSGNDYRIKKWHVDTGKIISTYNGPKTLPRGTDISPDGNKIASVWWNDEVWIWSDTGKAITQLNTDHKQRYLSQVSFSADGAQLRLIGASEVSAWDTRSWEKISTIIATELSDAQVLMGTAENYVLFTDTQGQMEVVSLDNKQQRLVLKPRIIS